MALAPKINKMVCAYNFFKTKENKADFASDYNNKSINY
jgi:hypothetical protein